MKFDIGGMWEFDEWEIIKDEEIHVYNDGSDVNKCKHCSDTYKKDNEFYFKVPYIVKAWNEGGYNSTGICLECILEKGNEFLINDNSRKS